MDLHQLIAPWNIPGPITFRQLDTGYINTIYAVEAPTGKYVLRVYKEAGYLPRILQEHRVAVWLQQAGLSFAVPAPIPTAGGETLANVDGRHVALIPFLPGVHPTPDNLPQVEAAGAALGELVTVLSRMEPRVAGTDIPQYRDLAADVDPLTITEWAPMEPDWRPRIRQVVESVLEKAPVLYDRLPRQVIHGDFTDGNILLEGNRVTGIFDFEFATCDLRAMDYAVMIGGGPCSLRKGWGEWPVLETLSRGYFRHHKLTEPELAALPDLIRLRRVNILLRFAGRYRQGLDPASVAEGMAWWTLHAEDWLNARGAELVQRAADWVKLP
ncbi:MAG TPA: homoserine kinase [Symbiobacteriaceae bacterium]|nr:homoserine kinase [Symbiobacteriaceae bacterium]